MNRRRVELLHIGWRGGRDQDLVDASRLRLPRRFAREALALFSVAAISRLAPFDMGHDAIVTPTAGLIAIIILDLLTFSRLYALADVWHGKYDPLRLFGFKRRPDKTQGERVWPLKAIGASAFTVAAARRQRRRVMYRRTFSVSASASSGVPCSSASRVAIAPAEKKAYRTPRA